MHSTQQGTKRVLDILLAIVGTIILLPLILLTAIILKFTSSGPVFFLQERVGKNGRSFMIWKFRSMKLSAEETGPQLSSDEDKRITTWGKIMRRWRLDELPQVWNVLKGDMSIVGPRPERKFYIDQIVKTHPEYLNLLKAKPGLTSMLCRKC
jgi:lipopolysaccharide/colanic/teichoic acid biosynthesis glycosyltransferase